MKIWIMLLVVFCACLGGLAQVFLKKGMTGFSLNDIITNYFLMAGVSLYVLAFGLYNFTLQFEKVTLLYPLIALSYIFMMLFAWLILREPVTLVKVIGSVVIVSGVWLISA